MNRPASGTYYEFVFDIYNRRVSTWGVGATSPTQALIYSDSSLLAFRSTSGTNFEHYNWVGTKRVITDYTGAVQETVTSLPFGDGYSYTGADGDWSDFAGMDGDTESNTEHAQFRQYSQNQGRWFSPDPYYGSYDFTNPQSFNRYAYALNNPVSNIDPSGLSCVTGDDGTEGDDGDGLGCADAGINPDGSEDGSQYGEYDVSGGDLLIFLGLSTDISCQDLALAPASTFSVAATNAILGGLDSISLSAYASPNNPTSTGFGLNLLSAAQMTSDFLNGSGPDQTDFSADSPESAAMAESTLVRQTVIGGYLTNGATNGTGNFEQYGMGPIGAGAKPMAQFVGGFSYALAQTDGVLYILISNETSANSLLYHAGVPNISRDGSGINTPLSTTLQTFSIAVPCK
jgi:RHS repeat-associated protein